MSDEAGAASSLEEAARLWEAYKRAYGMGTPTGADTAEQGSNALVRAFETIGAPAGQVVGGAAHVLGAPARALNAYATNLAGTQAPVSVSDYALYGKDMETGRRATSYGEVLAGELADRGEIAPGGKAEAIIRSAGDFVTDPVAAPAAIEAAGALAGRLGGGAAAAAGPAPRMRVRSRLDPAFRDMPKPAPKVPVDIDATQPVKTFNPTETQAVRVQQPGPAIKYPRTPKLAADQVPPKLAEQGFKKPQLSPEPSMIKGAEKVPRGVVDRIMAAADEAKKAGGSLDDVVDRIAKAAADAVANWKW